MGAAGFASQNLRFSINTVGPCNLRVRFAFEFSFRVSVLNSTSNPKRVPQVSLPRTCGFPSEFSRIRFSARVRIAFKFTSRPLRLNLQPRLSPPRIKSITAPPPILRIFHEPALHRIRVHVLEFFVHLLLTPDVEIIKPRLPKMRNHRGAGSPASQLQKLCRCPSLQRLHEFGNVTHSGFANQEMNVLRHHHIPGQPAPEVFDRLSEDLFEHIPSRRAPKQRHPPKTTERDEVKVAPPINALQFVPPDGGKHSLNIVSLYLAITYVNYLPGFNSPGGVHSGCRRFRLSEPAGFHQHPRICNFRVRFAFESHSNDPLFVPSRIPEPVHPVGSGSEIVSLHGILDDRVRFYGLAFAPIAFQRSPYLQRDILNPSQQEVPYA